LAAQYLTHDEIEDSLPIPKSYGKYDFPLIIQDKIFAKDGRLIFDDAGHSNLFGDVVLVNGKPWPVMQVERRKYRFRVLNASISRGYRLALSSGDPFTIIAHDGGLAPKPMSVSSFRIGMAERYEIVIDFAKRKVGDRVILKNLGVPSTADFDSTRNVMRFDVVSDATDTTDNEIPTDLNPNQAIMGLQPSEAVRTRKWVLERKDGLWTINGKIWDPERSDADVGLNDVEIWELTNKSGGWFHPLHIHLIDFKILDRNGKPPFAYERGPKDTVYIGENETVRVIARFRPNQGKYMMHCHNLVHEDHDMMTNFDVGPTGVDPSTIAPAKPLPAPPL
jgi:spore coat protein A, manganese oxidase